MQIISQFVQSHMDIVFFIYGLSFFFFGTAVFFQVRKGSDFRIGRHLWLLAMFGLLHGLNEWLDMFLMLQVGLPGMAIVEIVRFFIGKISYIFLFQFGIVLLCEKKGFRRLPKILLALYSLLIAGFFVLGCMSGFSAEWFSRSDAIIRYVLAFPSALLAAFAFLAERRDPEVRRLDIPSVSRGLTGLGITFLLYAVLAGLIVKPAGFFPASIVNYVAFTDYTGLPVQFFRAGCAMSMVFFLCKVLNIFEFETMHKLDNAYREIIRISNREQMRIGQDLHDDLGQQLTGIAYMSRVLRELLRTKSFDKADDVLSQVLELLDRSIDTTRNLSRGLYPASVEKEGMGFALQELVESTEKIFGISCSVEIDSALEFNSNENSIQLFRIAQEAVTNAIKHGKAKNVDIMMTRNDRMVTLSISDDGSGINDLSGNQNGIGLRIMRYRAGVLGGRLSVMQRKGGGTVVVCSFEEPLNEWQKKDFNHR